LCILFIILSLFTYLGVLPFEFTLQTMHHLRLQYHWQCHALDLHVRIQRRCQSLHDFAGQSRIDECGLQLDLVFAGQVANIGDVVSDAFEKVILLVVYANLLNAPTKHLDVELRRLALLRRVHHELPRGVSVPLDERSKDPDEVHVIELAQFHCEAAVDHVYA